MKGVRCLFYLGLAPVLCACGSACIPKSLAQFRDPAGVSFQVVRTDCDTLAKDSAVAITATRDGSDRSAVLLEYDPFDDAVPEIRIENGAITIHLDRVASILEKSLAWESFKVSIAVDRVLYQ